jgi:hypothetical protein
MEALCLRGRHAAQRRPASNAKRPFRAAATESAVALSDAGYFFAGAMSLNSTPPFALSSLADSTIVIVTALGST